MLTFSPGRRPSRRAKAAGSEVRGSRGAGGHHAAAGLVPSQQTVGNQFAQRRLQASSAEPSAAQTLEGPGDVHEREADRVAERVLHQGEPRLQTGGGEGAESSERLGGRAPSEAEWPSRAGGESSTSAAAPQGIPSTGKPLDPATRAFFEPRFGHDLGRVRIHRGVEDAAAARSVSAQAYTVGPDIVFGDGLYAPGTTAGRKLLAHELTHVIQQGAATRLGSWAERSSVPGIAHATRGPALQRQPLPPQQPAAPTAGQQQIYNQALARVQRLDRRMHGFLAAAPLNGARTNLHTASQTNAQGVTTTTTFRLEIKLQSLPNAYALLRRHPVAAPTGTGTRQARTVDMTMLIDPPTGANAVDRLTESLYHEGIHLLLQMDRYLPAAQQSPHSASLAAYRQVAQAHQDYARLLAELDLLINPHLRAQTVGANPSGPVPPQILQRIAVLSRDAAQSIVTDLIEEKLVENVVAPAMGRTRATNAAFALQEIGNDLVFGLGMTQQQLVSGTNLTAMRSIIARATRILDAIDQSLRRTPATPQPQPATPQPRPATPQPRP